MARGRECVGGAGRGVSRREVLRAGGVAALAAAAAGRATAETGPGLSVPPFEFEEATITGLQGAMASGRHTARSLAEAYLGRIEAVDEALRSVIEVNPEALEIADRLDEERRAGQVRSPLHGVPVLIKDNIATADRMETTAGSLALVGAKAPRDAFVVRRLREAGAVILGKTNLSEWANFRSSQSSSGWSGRGGQCANPYALDRNPCGSSSGSGAAIAANLAAVAVGTETDGSIVCPSHACGLVGLKPTLGLVSRSGIVPIAHSQDTAGPMARTVADAAALLAVLAGADPDDPTTAGRLRPNGYAVAVDAAALRGARIGVARTKVTGYSPEADAVFETALVAMREAGAVLVDPAEIPHLGEYDDEEFEVLLYEFKADLETYLKTWAPGASARTLADLIAFNEAHRAEELPYFGQEIFTSAVEKGPLTDKPYRKALAACRKLSRDEGLAALFEKHRLDAVVAPTGGPAWPTDLVNGDHFLGASSTPAAVSGYPSITVPAGFSFGLPVGITFIGRPWAELVLLNLAAAFETATKVRRPPRFLATADLTVG